MVGHTRRPTNLNEAHMNDDFDNEMGLPEDELGGGSATSDSGDLGLGGMDAEDEMESEAPGRPSGGARAKGSSGARARKRAAAPARKTAKRKAAGGGKKKGGRKTARKTARKGARKAAKSAGRGRKKARHR
jgi:hypothetical protein